MRGHSHSLCWLVAVTFTASYHKVLNPNPRIGFLAHARQLASAGADARLIFNDRLDADSGWRASRAGCGSPDESALEWARVLSGRKAA